MDKSKGFIPLYRSLLDHWVWEEKPYSKGQAWVDLILRASYQSHKFQFGNEILEVGPGTVITSELKLMERWGWSKIKVRRFLKLLESDSMIVKKSDHRRTTINIVNYRDFGNTRTDKEPIANHKRTDKEPIADTYNKDNKVNNISNDHQPDDPESVFQKIWKLYPRKLGKGKVSASQKKKLSIIGVEEMTRAIERYKHFICEKDPQYVMYGSTFFNSGYVDYLDANYKPEQSNASVIDWDSFK